jgi:murein DD-endopeptidase MepM/ murein hydrolase activator NlpD
MLSKLPESERAYNRMLAARGGIDQVAKNVAEWEIKGKPSEQKVAEYIQSLPAGPQKDMMLRQQYKDAFSGQTYYDEKGQEHKYSLPFAMPTPPSNLAHPSTLQPGADGTPPPAVTSPYGARNVPGVGIENHPGMDLAMNKGTPVNSFTSGTVKFAGDAGDGYGNKVVVQNPDGTTSLYAHLDSVGVKPGDTIDRNTPLGAAGQTGKATGPHLHFEVRNQQGMSIDPKTYLNPKQQTQAPGDLGGISPTSTQGIAALAGDYTRAQEDFGKEVRAPLFSQVQSEKDVPRDVDLALRVLNDTKVGPGASIRQAILEAKGVFKDLPQKELNDLINLKTLDQEQKRLVANGIKAAYGAQLSDKEGDRFTKTLFTIDDPKQFIRATLELKKANAIYNKEAMRFIADHQHNTAQEFIQWQNNGRYDQIMKENAPTAFAIANGGRANTPSAAAAQPVKHTDDAARQWLKDNPNHPDAPAVRKKLGL